jgi:hypothetical protein
MSSLMPEAFKSRMDELWPRHRRFMLESMQPTELSPKKAASLEKNAKEMVASVEVLRPQVDTLDVREEQRTVWHGSLSVFQAGVATYFSQRGRHAEACALAREAVRHCDYNAHLLEALVDALLRADLLSEAAAAVSNALDGTIRSEEGSTAHYILSIALEHPQFARELSASRIKQCVELVAEYSPLRNLKVCPFCRKEN